MCDSLLASLQDYSLVFLICKLHLEVCTVTRTVNFSKCSLFISLSEICCRQKVGEVTFLKKAAEGDNTFSDRRTRFVSLHVYHD